MTDLGELAKLADSDLLHARVNKLFDRLLDEVEWQFNNATPAGRNALLQKALPLIVAATRSEEDDAELTELRSQMAEMQSEIRQYLLPPALTPIDTTAEEVRLDEDSPEAPG